MINEKYYSTASVWEIAIKHMAHPDRMHLSGAHLSEGCNEMGYRMLPILDAHVKALESLTRPDNVPAHNDPFDRIMVAQAKSENLKFLTHDFLISCYSESCILYV